MGSTIDVWDWTQDETFTFYLDGLSGPIQVQTPFHLNSTVIPPNTNVYSLVPLDDQDFHPEDGWELLYRTFGSPGNLVPVASFAIYNRYEGVIRQLVYAPNADDDFNYATNSIGIRNQGGNFTGNMLMAFANSPIKSLKTYIPNTEDGFTIINQLTVGAFGFGSGTWIVAEAPVMYDPCVCFESSIIQSVSEAQSISSITLTGTSTGYSEAVYDDGETTSPFMAGAKTFNELGSTFKKFKSLSSAKDDASKRGFDIVGSVGSVLSGGELTFKILDFIVGGGKTSPPSIIGYRNEHEYSFGGNMNFSIPIVTNGIYTPGSRQTGLPPELNPVYNNPLGVFAMIFPPQIKYASEVIRDENPFDYCLDSEHRTWKYQFDPSTFFYVINTGAGIEDTPISMKAALKFSECVLEDDPAGSFLPNLTRDEFDPTIFTTPFMDIECLEDYTITLERNYEDQLGNQGCEEVRTGGWCNRVALVLDVQLMPTNPLPNQDPVEILLTLELERVSEGIDIDDIPRNDLSVEDAIDCSAPIPRPVSGFGALGLAAFCNNNYDPNFSGSDNQPSSDDPKYDLIARALGQRNSSTKWEGNNIITLESPKVYPNPSVSTVWVNVPETFAKINEMLAIKVINLEGIVVARTKVMYNGSDSRIDIGSLPDGQYAVEILNLFTGLHSVSMIAKQ